MYIRLLLLVLLSLNLAQLSAQSLDQYEKRFYIKDNDTLPYRLLLPKDYDAKKTYPLIIFLHGAGERGNDNEKQLTHGGALFLKDEHRNQFPAIVVFPQCSQTSFWSNVKIDGAGKDRQFQFVDGGTPTISMQLVMALTKDMFTKFRVEKDQVYVMGLSMGGMGTFEIVNRMPETFAAAIPICGGANIATAKNLKGVKWWVLHGGKDDVVPPKYSKEIVEAMKSENVAVKFTLFPEANHNSWDPAFAQPDLLTWLFSQKRKH